MIKPLNLNAKLYVRGGEAKLLTSTPDGKLVFHTDKGKVLVTDATGMADGKQKVFDTPAASTTSKFKVGDTVYYLRFGARKNHVLPCRFAGPTEKPGVFFIEPLEETSIKARGASDGRPRALLHHLYKSPQEAEAKVLTVLDSIRAYIKPNANGVITRKAGEQRA